MITSRQMLVMFHSRMAVGRSPIHSLAFVMFLRQAEAYCVFQVLVYRISLSGQISQLGTGIPYLYLSGHKPIAFAGFHVVCSGGQEVVGGQQVSQPFLLF